MEQSLLEGSVLGCLVIDPEGYQRIAGLLVVSDFSTSEGREIFNAIRKESDKSDKYNLITLADQYPHLQTSIFTLAQNTPSVANLEQYARALREKSQKRRVTEILGQAIDELKNPRADILAASAAMNAEIDSVLSRSMGTSMSCVEILRSSIESIEKASLARSKKTVAGIPSGLSEIDDRTGGFLTPQLVVVAARPSIGKTALSNQIALHASLQGHGVGICSLEMGVDELGTRMLANHYKLNGSALTFGIESAIQRMGEVMNQTPMPDLPLWVDCDTYSLGGVVARLGEWKRKHNIGLGIIDHIGLVEVDAQSVNERLGLISRTLKKTAKQLGIPIIAVSQLNRAVEREKRRPVLADLRDSGSIEQDADIAIFLHVAADQEGHREMEMEIGLLKNRRGRKGWLPKPLIFNGATQTFFS